MEIVLKKITKNALFATLAGQWGSPGKEPIVKIRSKASTFSSLPSSCLEGLTLGMTSPSPSCWYYDHWYFERWYFDTAPKVWHLIWQGRILRRDCRLEKASRRQERALPQRFDTWYDTWQNSEEDRLQVGESRKKPGEGSYTATSPPTSSIRHNCILFIYIFLKLFKPTNISISFLHPLMCKCRNHHWQWIVQPGSATFSSTSSFSSITSISSISSITSITQLKPQKSLERVWPQRQNYVLDQSTLVAPLVTLIIFWSTLNHPFMLENRGFWTHAVPKNM